MRGSQEELRDFTFFNIVLFIYVLPMGGMLGLSLLLLIVGYGTMNIVSAAVGFLLLFLSFGLVGSFIFNQIF